MKTFPILSALCAIFAMAQQAECDVVMPAIFGDHMVLQQNAQVTFWGHAKPYETVSVSVSWSAERPEVLVGRDGRWQLTVQTPEAGGPHTVTVRGWNELVFEDVLVGEVWLCSGQSNMEFSSEWIHNFARDMRAGRTPATFDLDAEEAAVDAVVAEADNPTMRLFTVAAVGASSPQQDLHGEWVVCTPETMKKFSLTGYFFGLSLQERLGVPVGLVNSSWGGTPCDVWTPPEAFQEAPVLRDFAAVRDKGTWGPYEPGYLYNAMIHPLAPFRFAGVIWNQGEENVGQSRGDELYAHMFSTMVEGWRKAFGQEMPFLYVQIPAYRYDAANPSAFRSAQLRDQQRLALSLIPRSAMIVSSDVGCVDDIHPVHKQPVGERLATWALNIVYHQTTAIPCGPLYKAMIPEGNAIRIAFDYTNGGLKSLDHSELRDFEIAGEDRVFHPAKATIDGDYVIVRSLEVLSPVAVRFAWRDVAMPNLGGGTGLMASTFRTDDWPLQ